MSSMDPAHQYFESVVSPYLRGLYAFIRGHAPSDPEDVYQETLLAAWRGFDRLREPDQLKPWLYAIARHKCLDALRGKYQRLEDAADDEQAEPGAQGFEQASAIRMDLHQALQALKPDDQLLLYLCYRQGFTNQEAGKLMGIPTGTVKSRLHALKNRLRASLEEE